MTPRVQMILWLLAALTGMGFSAIFSGVETGLYCLNRVRLRLRSESHEPRARILDRLLRNQRSLLASLLIGNNIANYTISLATVGLFSLTQLREWQIAVIGILIITPLLLIFSETVPKSIFQAYSDRYTYSFARLLLWTRRVLLFTGLLPLADALTGALMRLTSRRAPREADNLFHPRQQVRRLLSESHHQGTLTSYQTALVDRVMNLRIVRVSQVMVPLSKVVSTPADITREQFLSLVKSNNFSRIPVYRDRPANIMGIIHVQAVLASPDATKPPADFLGETTRLRPDARVVHALFTLQRTRHGVGIVTDKSGAIGIVTIKDLVDEIVGEIEEW